MLSSLLLPVIPQGQIGDGKLPFGVLHSELQKLLKDKVVLAELKAIQLSSNIAE